MASELSQIVEARLEECVVAGSSPKVYKIVKVIEAIERVDNQTAKNRWASIKNRAGSITIPGHRGSKCVREHCLDKLIILMKECESKNPALTTRGYAIDQKKVRHITLHAGDKQISVQVKCDMSTVSIVIFI